MSSTSCYPSGVRHFKKNVSTFTGKVFFDSSDDTSDYDVVHDTIEGVIHKILWSNDTDFIKQALDSLETKCIHHMKTDGEKDKIVQDHIGQLRAHVAVLCTMHGAVSSRLCFGIKRVWSYGLCS